MQRHANPAPWPTPPALLESRRALQEAEQVKEDASVAHAQSTLQALTGARRFAAAFQAALDTDPAIRAAATAPLSSGLQEGFAAADELLNTVLSPEHATLAFIGASGYRQWVAGPEAAVRRLVADSLQLFHAPTMAAAGSIKAALQAAADAAAASLPADLPDHLRDRLVELAADSIASWQAAARGQLHCFFLGEKTCPENESFAELQRQLTLLLSTPPAEEHEEPAAGKPAVPAATPAAQAKQAERVEDTEFFMGWLERLTSKGGWRKRWVVLEPRKAMLCYMQNAADRHPPTSFSLQGASVVDGPMTKPSRAGTVVRGSDPLVFHVSGAQAVGHSTTSIVTLRAATASAKEAWLAQLRAAVAGSNAEEPAKPVAAVLHRASTGGSEEAEGGVAAQGSVPRKISTAVFAEEPPAAAAAGEEEVGQADSANGVQEEDEASEASDDPEAAAAAQLAAEEALVADIAAQAAQRSLRPGEQAVLQAALKAIKGYVHAARGRLLRQAHKTLSTHMLLGRREAMDQALLAVVLPPGVAPPRADVDDGSV